MERRHSSTETSLTTASSAQPESTSTDSSNFTDSAIHMDATITQALSHTSNKSDDHALSLSPISQTLADRMRRLAAAAWTSEQDDEMPESKRRQVEHKIRSIESLLEDKDPSDFESQNNYSMTEQVDQHSALVQGHTGREREEEHKDWIDESDLLQIHDNLAEVVASMRLRQQEQRHLHQLTATKLEVIAQRCLFQEQQMQGLVREMETLRVENRSLGQENDKLRDTIVELETEATKNEVAVSAMTSAVAGLEGWIDDTDRAREGYPAVTSPVRASRPHRAVVRGKGRFRGRYYVDDEYDQYFTRSSDARELQDGVRAWIRGFRDVEDACSSPISSRKKELLHGSVDTDEDDWGEFARPVPNA